ncbi:sexual differentiation process protein [Trichophyton mentagrophytes]|nr:sexual differentiation process protein [Trichophyton mentagrophytes]
MTKEYVEPANIPIIDFRALTSENPGERKGALNQLDEAFQTYGFIYLSNHSIGQKLVDEAFSWSQRFFHLPRETKALCKHQTVAADHRGWAAVGTGIVSQDVWDKNEIEKLRKTAPIEQKEILEMGNPHSKGGPGESIVNRLLPDDVFPGFRAFIEKWWDACFKQQLEVLRALCEILGYTDLDYLGKQQDPSRSRNHMSWLYYLSQPVAPLRSGESNRLNTHTDFTQLTLLFQDMVGGLEVHDYDAGIFRPVLPKPGTMIVHVGDMLEKQSNGKWKSALHHVSAPSHLKYGDEKANEDTVVERFSMSFYGTPQHDVMIQPIPGCEAAGKWQTLQWEPNMTAGDWIHKRVALEYGDGQQAPQVVSAA